MKERFDNTLPYLIVTIAFYYLLPLICVLIGAPQQLYNISPVVDICVAIIVCFFFGKRYGGDWLMALEVAAVYIPCASIYFRRAIFRTTLVIAIFSAFSVFIGAVFRKRIR